VGARTLTRPEGDGVRPQSLRRRYGGFYSTHHAYKTYGVSKRTGERPGRRIRVKRYAPQPEVILSIAVGTRAKALATAAVTPDVAREIAAALEHAADLADGGAT
jgi:hypothetical protein